MAAARPAAVRLPATGDGPKVWARRLCLWSGFLIVYVALDRLDAAIALGPMTPSPWDLAGGLAFAFLLLQGPRVAPLVALAEIASTLTSRAPHPSLLAVLASGATLALAYALAAALLRARGSLRLVSQKVLLDLALAAVAAALARAAIDVLLSAYGGGLQAGLWAEVFDRFAGALAGIAVVAPLFMALRRPPRRPSGAVLLETGVQAILLVAAIMLIFAPHPRDPFRYFYLAFLPQIWIAVRRGVAGAVLGNFVVQVGLIALLIGQTGALEQSFNYQMRLLALAASTLFLGVAVRERRAIETALRQRQDQLSRVARLSLAGEMAAALAHELNQPLLATIAFSRTAQTLIAHNGAARADGRVVEALEGAVGQAERAGAIVRSLRRFMGRSDGERRPQAFDALAKEAVTLIEPECARAGARIVRLIDRELPVLNVDAVQIQQVLINLIQNALDALVEGGAAAKTITLGARASGVLVEVEVRDNGPGVAADIAAALFSPFVSGKAAGMGLGLAISRGIIEAHGGRLWLAENQPGCCAFRFTLPAAPPARTVE